MHICPEEIRLVFVTFSTINYNFLLHYLINLVKLVQLAIKGESSI
jgi:hypothetical protein